MRKSTTALSKTIYKAPISDITVSVSLLLVATITSESGNHSRIAAFSCVNRLIKLMEEKIKPIIKVIVWSDGMGAQFRSRFVFKLLSTIHHAIDLEWHYNEAHHGKGPMDGVGGTIKNLDFRAVKSGKVLVRDPEEFLQ